MASKPHEEDRKIHLQPSGSLIMEEAPLHVGSNMNLNLSSSVSAPIRGIELNSGNDIKLYVKGENVSNALHEISEMDKPSSFLTTPIYSVQIDTGSNIKLYSEGQNVGSVSCATSEIGELSSSLTSPINDVKFHADSDFKLNNISKNMSGISPDMSEILSFLWKSHQKYKP
ncbi:hypothetical protein [Bartonella pachyuromydis]